MNISKSVEIDNEWCQKIEFIIIIGIKINVQMQEHHPHQWAAFHVAG